MPNVALIEDDPTCRLVLGNQFRSHGAKVTVYDNGRQFLTACATEPLRVWDLVVTDQTMPEITGTDMLMHTACQFVLATARVNVLTGTNQLDGETPSTEFLSANGIDVYRKAMHVVTRIWNAFERARMEPLPVWLGRLATSPTRLPRMAILVGSTSEPDEVHAHRALNGRE